MDAVGAALLVRCVRLGHISQTYENSWLHVSNLSTYNFTNKGHSISLDNFDTHWGWSWARNNTNDGRTSDEKEAGLHGE